MKTREYKLPKFKFVDFSNTDAHKLLCEHMSEEAANQALNEFSEDFCVIRQIFKKYEKDSFSCENLISNSLSYLRFMFDIFIDIPDSGYSLHDQKLYEKISEYSKNRKEYFFELERDYLSFKANQK